jgi:Mce-associated membrane protein
MSVIDTENRSDDAPPALSEDGGTDVKNTIAPTSAATESDSPSSKSPRRLSISVRTATLALVICIFAGAAGVFGWLYMGASDKLTAQDQAASDRSHAEDVATGYAVNAAEMNYQDFNAWKVKLVNGTTPELKDKLTKAADSMQQILAPLQWQSTAHPLAAKVRSVTGGIYVVDAFVSVLTKTMQAPDGLQSTATYSVTLDGNNNWQITDVGGIDAVLGK